MISERGIYVELRKKDFVDMVINDSADIFIEYINQEYKKGIFEKENDNLNKAFESLLCISSTQLFMDISKHFFDQAYHNRLTTLDKMRNKVLFGCSENLFKMYTILSRLTNVNALGILNKCYFNGIKDCVEYRDVTFSEANQALDLLELDFETLCLIIPENDEECKQLKILIDNAFMKRVGISSWDSDSKLNFRLVEDELRVSVSSKSYTIPLDPILWKRPYYKEIMLSLLETALEYEYKTKNSKKPTLKNKIISFPSNHSKQMVNQNYGFVYNRNIYNYNKSKKEVTIFDVMVSIKESLKSIKREDSDYLDFALNLVERVDENISYKRTRKMVFVHHKEVISFIDTNFKEHMNKIIYPTIGRDGKVNTNFDRTTYAYISNEQFFTVFNTLDIKKPVFEYFSRPLHNNEWLELYSNYHVEDLIEKIKKKEDIGLENYSHEIVMNQIEIALKKGEKIPFEFYINNANYFKLFDLQYPTMRRKILEELMSIIIKYYTKEERFDFLKNIESRENQMFNLLVKDLQKVTFSISQLINIFQEDIPFLENVISYFHGRDCLNLSLIREVESGKLVKTIVYGKVVYHKDMLISRDVAENLGMVFID